MQFRRFGRTELQVSEISLGGAYISGTLSNQLDPDARCENAIALVERALELGVNYIDTAPLYGDSESLVGSALGAVGKKMHIATKVGFDPEGFDYDNEYIIYVLLSILLSFYHPLFYYNYYNTFYRFWIYRY